MKRTILLTAFFCIFCSYYAESQSTALKPRYDSYKGLIMAGYQGWFAAVGDESNHNWYHYGLVGDTAINVDFWPDMTEYTKKYVSPFKMADGTDAYLYSAYDEETIDLHFRWMKEYGIDGVFMQRFVNETKKPQTKRHINKVLENALKAARKYDRAIGVMYDLTGCRSEDMALMEEDWRELLRLFDLANLNVNPTYLWHNSKPLVTIWGVGFNDNRRYSIADTEQAIGRMKKEHALSFMLGVPYHWRLFGNDTEDNPLLHTLIKNHIDIVMPWAVGRYNYDNYEKIAAGLADDFKWCSDNNVFYVPLVFPGFTWGNLRKNPKLYNQIPRMKGDFLWKQVSAAKAAGATALYLAMFDEIDEGTAFYKCAEEGKLPVFGAARSERRFVGIEEGLGSDYYLWLAGEVGKWIKGGTGYTNTKPQRP